MTISGEVFCIQCGGKIAADARFCTACGSPRAELPVKAPTPQTLPSAWQPVAQEPMHTAPIEAPEPPRRRPIGITAGIAVAGLLLIAGGYWYFTASYDYSAETASELFRGRDSQVQTLILQSCGSLENVVNDVGDSIAEVSIAVSLNYAEGLKTRADAWASADGALRTWATQALSMRMGSKVSKLDNPESVTRDLYRRAAIECPMDFGVNKLLKLSSGLDSMIRQIKSPPANWEGKDYYRSDQDPNLAWKWAPDNSYYCSGSTNCVRVYIKAHRPCYRATVVVENSRTRTGSSFDTDSGSITNLRKGRVYGLTIPDYDAATEWYTLKSLRCG